MEEGNAAMDCSPARNKDAGNTDNIDRDINSAWKSENYGEVLRILQVHDCKFPNRFKLEGLNIEDDNQKCLIDFATDRDSFHELIRQDQIEEVKEFTRKKKSKNYFNCRSRSAAFTAITCKKFKIYGYLLSIGVSLLGIEQNEIDKLNYKEKENLRQAIRSYSSNIENSHIHYIISKLNVNSQTHFDKDALFAQLEKLDKNENISVILKVVQYVDDLELFLNLDEDNVKPTCPFAKKRQRGLTYPISSTIYVAYKRPQKQMLGTFVHELAHMALQSIFENDCNPYSKSDEGTRKEFQEITEFIKNNVPRITNTPSEILTDAFGVYEGEEESELIVRVPHILSQYDDDGEEWLNQKASKLFDFYKEKIVPKCAEFITETYLRKPRKMNRIVNERSGEYFNIINHFLLFNDIGTNSRLNNANKKIITWITKYTWLGLLRILQTYYGVRYDKYFDRCLCFNLRSFMENEIIESLFCSEATDMLIIECPDGLDGESNILIRVKNMMRYVKKNNNKKIIFVLKEKQNEHLVKILEEEKLSDVFLEYPDKEVSLNDLDKESKEKILQKKVLFQEEEMCLGDLLNGDENLLKCINEELIQDFLNGKKIEIGSKLFRMSNLEGSYADIAHYVDLDTLIYEIKSSKDIFIIYEINGERKWWDEKEKLIKYLYNDDLSDEHKVSINERVILVEEENADDEFKRFCIQNWMQKVYFLKVAEEKPKFTLITFYNPDFYFGRQFKKYDKVAIKKEILEEHKSIKVSDVFVIGKDPDNAALRNNAKSSKIILCDANDIENKFQKCRQIYKVVHLVKSENSQLIWDKSSGSLSGLRPWIKEEDSREEDITNERDLTASGGIIYLQNERELIAKIKDEKVVILADDPGMGKSTTLTKLYHIGNGSDNLANTHWVIRICLKDHITSIQNMKNVNHMTSIQKMRDIKIEQVITFLTEVDHNLKNKIGKKVLESALDKNKNFHKSLLIAFDGFDELLDNDDRKKIVTLLKFLKNETKCKIWVTTRLHLQSILEDELSTFAIRFVPVGDESKIKFIKNYFKYRVKLLLKKDIFDEVFEGNKGTEEGLGRATALERYATVFKNRIKKIFKEGEERFMGTPLQLHLLLEDSVESFRSWAEKPIDPPDFSYLGDNLLDVYKGFFGRKYKIFFRKKRILEESVQGLMNDLFEKIHEELAQSMILKEKLPERIEKHKSLILLIGILKTGSHNVEFTHFIFRDYSFAQLLIKNILDQRYHTLFIDSGNLFIRKVLVEKEYKLIRNFINKYLKNKKSLEFLKNLTKLRKTSFWKKEKSAVCGFCVAVQENHNYLLKSLFSIGFSNHDWYDFLVHKEICTQKIFYLSVQQENDFALNLIVDKISECDLNAQYEFLKIPNEKGQTILHHAIIYKNESALNIIFKMGSEFIPEQQYELLKIPNEKGQTILHVAVEYTRNSALNRIIEIVSEFDLHQQEQFLGIVSGISGTALHLAIKIGNNYALEQILQMISRNNFEEKFQYELLNIVGGKPNKTTFHLAVEIENLEALNKMIEMTSKWTSQRQFELLCIVNRAGNTVLHVAIIKRNNIVLNRIIDMMLKLDLNQQYNILMMAGALGDSVLHIAVQEENENAFNQLTAMTLAYPLSIQEELLSKVNKNGKSVIHLIENPRRKSEPQEDENIFKKWLRLWFSKQK